MDRLRRPAHIIRPSDLAIGMRLACGGSMRAPKPNDTEALRSTSTTTNHTERDHALHSYPSPFALPHSLLASLGDGGGERLHHRVDLRLAVLRPPPLTEERAGDVLRLRLTVEVKAATLDLVAWGDA